jgi:hypothetical protein
VNGKQLREEIFRLLMRQDQCEDPGELVALQFALEEHYRTMSCLTGKSPEAIEIAILSQYPDWLRQRLDGGGEG